MCIWVVAINEFKERDRLRLREETSFTQPASEAVHAVVTQSMKSRPAVRSGFQCSDIGDTKW